MTDPTAPTPAGLPQARGRLRVAAVLVDAGYLFAAMAEHLAGSKCDARATVHLTGQGRVLIARLRQAAAEDGLDVLRVYWFDGARDRRPTAQQIAVGLLGDVRLSLGDMSQAGQQKGVDKLVQSTLRQLGDARAVTDVVLVSGDQDFAEELAYAADCGLRTHVWEIRGGDDCGYNMSRQLRFVADSHRRLDGAWIGQVAQRVDPADADPGDPGDTGARSDTDCADEATPDRDGDPRPQPQLQPDHDTAADTATDDLAAEVGRVMADAQAAVDADFAPAPRPELPVAPTPNLLAARRTGGPQAAPQPVTTVWTSDAGDVGTRDRLLGAGATAWARIEAGRDRQVKSGVFDALAGHDDEPVPPLPPHVDAVLFRTVEAALGIRLQGRPLDKDIVREGLVAAARASR